MSSDWSRRELLIGGGVVAGLGALTGAGAIGYSWPRSTTPDAGTKPSPSPAAQATNHQAAAEGVHSYLSRTDLQPPRLSVDVFGSPPGVPPYIFLANKPYRGPQVGQRGLLIAQRNGETAWFSPITSGQVLNFNVQSYQGKPVLTWWHGITGHTFGHGNCYITDSSYSPVATVKAGNGLGADMHEFNLTGQGTALIEAYQKRNADLSAIGGPANGGAWSGVVQEIDIATGDVVFEWSTLDHVPVTETQAALSGTGTMDNPFDYFHVNAIAEAADGDLLVSSRNTWTVYKVGRHDGKIRWRLGGKNSDFTFGPGAKFYWQHHVRAHGPDLITIFDNASSPPKETQSRGLLLRLDTAAMHVTLERAYTNPAHLLADNQGSMQLMAGNRAFVGWGAEPYFTEFDSDGSMLLNGHLPVGDQSYRAFTADWTGHPKDQPAVFVKANPARGSAVYVSWNGATEVATWRVHAGKRSSSLDVVATQPRSGFETVIAANSPGPYFAVTAHDSSGKLIGQSATTKSG